MIAQPRQLRGDAGAPGVGAVGGEEGDARAGLQAEPHEHALDAADQFDGALIGQRSAGPGESRAAGIARQRPQRLRASRRTMHRADRTLFPPACFVIGFVSCQCLRATLAQGMRDGDGKARAGSSGRDA